MKARVFISCGQRKDTEEVDTAEKVADILTALGYDPYIAVLEKSLRGLKENLLQRLLESEYFLFIDFRRELLPFGECRGSLFCHQELAVAAFLEKQVLAFQQKGIYKLDGFLGVLQANAVEFETEQELLTLLVAEVAKEWRMDWCDELKLEISKLPQEETHHQQGKVRYWFLDVVNANGYRTAHDCYGYLSRAYRLEPPSEHQIPSVEYKWTGYTFPSVIIPPRARRQLDAFMVYHNAPFMTAPSTYSDSVRHRHSFTTGEYLLEFAVHSSNFRDAHGIFFLRIGIDSVNSVEFREASEDEKKRLPKVRELPVVAPAV